MIEYKQIAITSEAIEYLRECLSSGHTLSHILLQRADLNRGTIYTFVPPEVDERVVSNVRNGWLLAGPEDYVNAETENGSMIRMAPTPDTDPILASIISEYLQANTGRVVIFEEAMAKPSDPCMRTVKKTLWQAFDNEVYYVLRSRDSVDSKISRAIKDAKSAYPGLIGAMTAMPEIQSFAITRRKLTLDKLRELGNKTEKIIIGAYDGEGYLIWNKPAEGES